MLYAACFKNVPCFRSLDRIVQHSFVQCIDSRRCRIESARGLWKASWRWSECAGWRSISMCRLHYNRRRLELCTARCDVAWTNPVQGMQLTSVKSLACVSYSWCMIMRVLLTSTLHVAPYAGRTPRNSQSRPCNRAPRSGHITPFTKPTPNRSCTAP
jgi:hypothetical protein